MERKYDTKKRRPWQYVSGDFRQRIKALADNHQREMPATRKSYRFPTAKWAEQLGVDASTVRRELKRGKSRQGNESEGKSYWVYDPAVSEDKAHKARAQKGRESSPTRRAEDPIFKAGLTTLDELLRRKSTLKNTEGHYSIYAATEVAKRTVPGFHACETTVRKWIKDGVFPGLTMAKVRIWKRKKSNPDKKTVPHNAKAKVGHHIQDRPKEVDELKEPFHFEGDTVVSCKGDKTAVLSVIERVSDYQFFRIMSRNTTQCLHGALKVIVGETEPIKSITWDNGMEMSCVKRLEEIVANGRERAFRNFYADAYASNQRGRNEKNHVFFRRFAGHGRLANLSQRDVQHITDFINDYPRRKFYGKTSREIYAEIKAGKTPLVRPKQLKKWQKKKEQQLVS